MKKLYTNVQIPPTKGNNLIKDSKLFYYIDSDFKEYGLTKKESQTTATDLEVYEMDKDGTFKELFESLGNPEQLVMTQEQILSFIENHKDKLRTDGWATFFLLKKDSEFFVAFVRLYSVGHLEVLVHRFSFDSVWYAGNRSRVVVPATVPDELNSIDSLKLSDIETLSLRVLKIEDTLKSIKEML